MSVTAYPRFFNSSTRRCVSGPTYVFKGTFCCRLRSGDELGALPGAAPIDGYRAV